MIRVPAVAVGVLVLAGCTSSTDLPVVASDTPSTPAATSPSPTSASPAGTPDQSPTPEPGTDTPSASPTRPTSPTASPPAADATPAPPPATSEPAPEPTPTPPPPEPEPEPERRLLYPPDRPFSSQVHEVAGNPEVRDRMVGVSWRSGCPVPLEDLRYLRLSHVGLDGAVRTGELVVRADVVDDVLTAMRRMYEIGFPIQRMRLVSDYGGDDDASMRANNTSAFNCRTVAGTSRWSNHAYGTAVDINPLRNPYVRGGTVDPPEGAAYADRSNRRPGMLHAGTRPVAAWTDLGWGWGGYWSSGQDYQHVSLDGT